MDDKDVDEVRYRQDYWSLRASRARKGFAWLKRSKIVRCAFRSRSAVPTAIAWALGDESDLLIVDLACGGGTSALTARGTVIGVDLPGFPKELAKSNGYTKAYSWEDFPLDDYLNQADVVTIFQANAHMEPTEFLGLLMLATRLLNSNGRILMVTETDSDCVIFDRMRQDEEGFRRYLKAVDHTHWVDAAGFRQEILLTLPPGLVTDTRHTVLSQTPPHTHWYQFLGRTNLGWARSLICLVLDFGRSCRECMSQPDRGFLEAYELRIHHGIEAEDSQTSSQLKLP